MMLAAVALAAILAGPADDYFPLKPGTKWTYEDENGVRSIDEAQKPLALTAKLTATPVTTTVAGRDSGAMFYLTDPNVLYLVGFGPSAVDVKNATLLTQPQPIFHVGEPKTTWTFAGEMPGPMGPVLVRIKGSSECGKKVTVLGKEVESLSLRTHSRIGNDKVPVEIDQDALYGKGIGLVELKTVTKASGKAVSKSLKLIKFEPVPDPVR